MAESYVQVQPDSTGAKIQVFENTLDLTNVVEAQATVRVDAQGKQKGVPGNADAVRSYPVEVLLTAILAELRKLNWYMAEINPRLLGDRNEFTKEDFGQVAGITTP